MNVDIQKTIPENFFLAAEKHGKKKALKYKRGDVYYSISFKKLVSRIKIAAKSFRALGIKPGDRVAILSSNRPEWVITDMAVMSCGGVTVPIHTNLSPKIISHVLNHSEAEIVVVSDLNLLIKIFVFQKKLKSLKKIIFLGDIDRDSKSISAVDILDWQKFIELGKDYEFILEKTNPEDVCSIIYTSGTTGLPKGVQLTHLNFLSNVSAISKAVYSGPGDTFLSFLPLSHVLERTAGYYTAILFGSCIVYAKSHKELPQALKEAKPTILISVPRIFEKTFDAIWDRVNQSKGFSHRIFLWALKQDSCGWNHFIADFLVFKKIRKKMGGHLRFAVSGGASLDAKIAKFFLKIGIVILEGYGLTETAPMVSVNSENDYKFGTVGKIADGVQVKISEDKEILVKGPNVMVGYYKDEKETSLAIDEDGWLHTGDIGFVDLEGRMTITGRKKEMIVTSGGKNVWPAVIEHELNWDRFVSQSMVIGNRRKFISALIAPDWSEVDAWRKEQSLSLVTPEELLENPKIRELFQARLEKINLALADHEKIRNFCLLVDDFSQDKDEITPTLKLRRHIIESHYQKEIEEMYK
jgi:long-chain acyl-CoA synthetase